MKFQFQLSLEVRLLQAVVRKAGVRLAGCWSGKRSFSKALLIRVLIRQKVIQQGVVKVISYSTYAWSMEMLWVYDIYAMFLIVMSLWLCDLRFSQCLWLWSVMHEEAKCFCNLKSECGCAVCEPAKNAVALKLTSQGRYHHGWLMNYWDGLRHQLDDIMQHRCATHLLLWRKAKTASFL